MSNLELVEAELANARTGGLLYRHYECVAIGAKDDLLRFRRCLRLIAGDFA